MKNTLFNFITKVGVAGLIVLTLFIVFKPIATHKADAEQSAECEDQILMIDGPNENCNEEGSGEETEETTPPEETPSTPTPPGEETPPPAPTPTEEESEDCSGEETRHHISGEIVSTGSPATGRLTNSSGCTYTVSIATYKMFVPAGEPDWITSQELFDYTTLTIGPNQTLETDALRVSVPECRYQIDLIEGNPLTPPDYGAAGNGHWLFDADYGGDQYCGDTTTPSPAITPTVVAPACSSTNYSVEITWPAVNNNIDIFIDDNGSVSSWWKPGVDGSTGTTSAPDGFVQRLGAAQALTFAPGTTHSTFIQNNGTAGQVISWTVPNCTEENTPPEGYLDSASCTHIGGWARDPDALSSHVMVKIYDGVISSGNLVTTTTANEFRSDVGNHAFGINTPVAFLDGLTHQVYAYAVDLQTGTTHLLTQSPKTITCTVAVNTPPVITVSGANPITVPKCSAYSDLGATATDAEDGNLTANIVKTGSVDTSTVGTYHIKYNVTDSGGLSAVEKIRTVNVTGSGSCINTPPTITLLGSNPVSISQCSSYTDAGATATDAEDGNLTSSIQVVSTVVNGVVGNYTVKYNVTDSGGLSATEVTRVVNITSASCGNNTPPAITLTGSSTVSLSQCSNYNDAGATATDAEDGNLTANIIRTGNVTNGTPGTYILKFNVSDSQGLAAPEVTRTVTITPATCGGGGGGGGGGPIQPSIITNSCSNINNNGFTLNGKVDSNGGSITAYFEWGTDSSNLTTSTTQNNFNTSPTEYTYNLSGLTPNTTYYYRAVAKNTSNSKVQGNIMSCKTSGTTPAGVVVTPTTPVVIKPEVVKSSTTLTTVRTVSTSVAPKSISIALAKATPIQAIQCFAVGGPGSATITTAPAVFDTNQTLKSETLFTASAITTGAMFLPAGLFGWMILIILILLLVRLGQHLLGEHNGQMAMEQAHHH